MNEREKESDRETLYKNETGRVGRCSCCRRCHPLTTVLVLHVFERAHCRCVGGGGAGFNATNHAVDVKGRSGGLLRSLCVYVRARSFLVSRFYDGGWMGGMAWRAVRGVPYRIG